tara:strand:- start:310 stop:588 length:279 start_codon:yes stop_codon:yes gene_type:complete
MKEFMDLQVGDEISFQQINPMKKGTDKKYRFFFHYYKRFKCMSIHYKNQCLKADNVICSVPIETKWNKTQPNLIMRGFANSVKIENGVCYIE